MTVSARQLNRATLERQLLLERAPLDVVGAVRRLVGLQAQEPASPYLALWNRVAGFDPAALDAAFAAGTLVKASLLRITLHAVAAADHPVLHAAMLRSLRGSCLGDPRFTAAGLTVAEADALVPRLVGYANRSRTKADLEAHLAERLGGPAGPGLWWALRRFSPLRHAPTGGPWSFGLRPSYLAAPPGPAPAEEEATAALVERYLAAFGPATVADVAGFTMIQRSRVRAAVRDLGEAVRPLPGTDLLDLAGATLPAEDTPAPPRLLGMWDNVLLAYADRSRLIPPRHRPLVIRVNGDVLPTLLVDGQVAGVWRPVGGGIEATAFEPLPDEAWAGLAAEARALVALLADRDPGVYGRYGRWWAKLPPAEVRVLPG